MTDYVFKYIIIGDSGVGKSCLLMQFIENRFSPTHDITIGVEFGAKIIKLSDPEITSNGSSRPSNKNAVSSSNTAIPAIVGKVVKIQVWDTAGQEHFRSITRSYFRGAVGAILVYDIFNRNSFLHIQDWLRECRENSSSSQITILLVGNKVDLLDPSDENGGRKRDVSMEEGKEFADRHGLLFLETSAKSSEQVYKAFEVVTFDVCEKIWRGVIDSGALRGDDGRVRAAVSSISGVPRDGKNGCC